MKIAICDDDKEVLSQLREFVLAYAKEHLLDYTVLEFEQAEPLLEAAGRDSDIRILFLDIYMSPLSGMDLAEKLRAAGNDCAIIFVTVSTDHYARSYEVDARHYLVKPVTYERVSQALARCENTLRASAKYALFSAGGQELPVLLRQIRYVEVFRNQTILHADRDYTVRCPLETVIQKLDDRRFYRSHRSFLINMEYIARRQGNDLCLTTGEKVPLSRSCEKRFEQEYGRFLTAAMTGEG